MEILISIRPGVAGVNREEVEARVSRVLAELSAAPDVELSLLFCDQAEMAGLNKRYLDREGPTNVIAFPMAELGTEDAIQGMLGDVAVCPAYALNEAEEHGLDGHEHLFRLIIHGMLHLLGYDHEQGGAEAEVMENLTEKLLKQTASAAMED